MSDESASPDPLSPPDVRERLAEGEVELIDVREAYEFEAGHIDGARHIGINELTSRAAELPRDREIVFYCRTGNRSSLATDAFAQAGYDVRNMSGGLLAWNEAGLPLVPEGGEVAERVPPST